MVLYIGNHTSSSKGGKAKEIDPADVEKFLELAREHHFGKIVAHAPYTMNACAAKENLRDFAREIMADDLKRMEYTPGNYYNFHPGSHVGQGIEAGIAKIAEILMMFLQKNKVPQFFWKLCPARDQKWDQRFRN